MSFNNNISYDKPTAECLYSPHSSTLSVVACLFCRCPYWSMRMAFWTPAPSSLSLTGGLKASRETPGSSCLAWLPALTAPWNSIPHRWVGHLRNMSILCCVTSHCLSYLLVIFFSFLLVLFVSSSFHLLSLNQSNEFHVFVFLGPSDKLPHVYHSFHAEVTWALCGICPSSFMAQREAFWR